MSVQTLYLALVVVSFLALAVSLLVISLWSQAPVRLAASRVSVQPAARPRTGTLHA